MATLPFLAALPAADQIRLKALTEDFLGEKEFTHAGDLELTDAVCVSIAAQGCLPILELGLGYYRDWVGIVVYPDEFVIPRTIEDEFGVTHEYDDIASGEAWDGGPLIVSWNDARMAGDGYNVVIHEFAHKLDMLNGDADGMPPLPSSVSPAEWRATFEEAYARFCEEVDTADARDEDTEIDPYGAESPGEFFAVLSEIFFETPEVFLQHFPALYGLFTRFYRQNPAKRAHPPTPPPPPVSNE